MRERTLRMWRQVALWLFAAAALGWACLLLWNAWPELQHNFSHLHKSWLMLTFAGTLLGSYLGFEAFRAIVMCLRPQAFTRLRLAHLYFTAQLMKHLPGRIWGVAYQASAGAEASAIEWVGINAAYMILSTLFAVWVAAATMAFVRSWFLVGVGLVLGGAALYVLGWHRAPLGFILRLLGRFPGRAMASLRAALQVFADVDASFKVRLFSLLVASWVVYLAAWAGFGMAWPGLSAQDGVELCALYTLAWFVGYVSFVTPSGVGVRELVFVLLARAFPADAIAAMAILARAVLLLVDIVLGAAFAPFSQRPASASGTRESNGVMPPGVS